jgi:hypothetical protein
MFAMVLNAFSDTTEIKRPFVKYEDGSVYYVGKYLHESLGDTPKDDSYKHVHFIMCGFKVADVTDNGCRVIPYNESGELDYDNDLFLLNFNGLSDRSYGAELVKKRGYYTYQTTGGSSRKIPQAEYGTKSTKQEYLDYCKKMGWLKQSDTNTVTTVTNTVTTNSVPKK